MRKYETNTAYLQGCMLFIQGGDRQIVLATDVDLTEAIEIAQELGISSVRVFTTQRRQPKKLKV
jgi:DNA-directed RNA polymerase specialized sigma24 family protein